MLIQVLGWFGFGMFLGIALLALYEFGRSKGYREGFTDGSGYRWGADSPGDLNYRKD